MSLFIRDEIPVRKLSKRWKRLARAEAGRAGWVHFGAHSYHGGNMPRWRFQQAAEQLCLKGA